MGIISNSNQIWKVKDAYQKTINSAWTTTKGNRSIIGNEGPTYAEVNYIATNALKKLQSQEAGSRYRKNTKRKQNKRNLKAGKKSRTMKRNKSLKK